MAKDKKFDKRSKGNGKYSGKSREDRGSSSYSGNDLSWYTKYRDMVDAAAKFPFPYVPGRRISIDSPVVGDIVSPSGYKSQYDYYYPGVMTLEWYPTVGNSKEITSPINVAASEIYAKVRDVYSGALEADAPDIMMYIMAVDSLYALIEDMKRAYYLVNAYTPNNELMPKALVQSLGYDHDDLRAKMPLMEQRIIEAISLASKFRIPAAMDIVKRHQFMSANIYADEASQKAQLYAFKLGGIYRIRENTDIDVGTTGSTYLEMVDRPDQFLTVEQAWEWFHDSVKALMEWDTSYTIRGYLMRAFDGVPGLVPSPLVPNAVLNPVYNPDMLLQIQNATIMPVASISLDVAQDVINGNTLICRPMLKQNVANDEFTTLAPSEVFMVMPGDVQPTSDQVIYASRLMCVRAVESRDTNLDSQPVYITCGTEVLTKIEMTGVVSGIPFDYPTEGSYTLIGDEGSGYAPLINDLAKWMQLMATVEAFDHHPAFVAYIYAPNKTGTSVRTLLAPFLAAENVTTVDSADLENLHKLCVYSEFNSFDILK